MTGILDPALVSAVKKFEGYSANPYWDYKQHTSGYGTRATPGETIDQATAEQRLAEELQKAAGYVNNLHPDMPSGVRNALTSLTFNAGPKWINSGLGELVKAGDWQGAQARLLEYNKAGGQVNSGLVNRRAQEASWFGGGMPAQGAQTPQLPAYSWSPGANQSAQNANQPTGAAPTAPPMSQQARQALTFEQLGQLLGLHDPPPLQMSQPMAPFQGPFSFNRRT